MPITLKRDHGGTIDMLTKDKTTKAIEPDEPIEQAQYEDI